MSASAEAMVTPSHHHSRDPGGVTASGVEMISGEDPIGLPPEASSAVNEVTTLDGGAPPTPTRRNTTATTPVMALLVGAPPPPPTSPPPKKKRSSSRKKPRPQPLQVPSIQSVDDTATATTLTGTTASPNTKASRVVEQRRQAALMIYESEQLVLDPSVASGNDAENNETPTTDRLAQVHGPALALNQENQSPRKPSTPKQQPPSPMGQSQATEPHSNQAPLSMLRVEPVNGLGGEVEEPLPDAPTPNRKNSRPKTPERIHRVLGRSKTPEARRRSKTPEARRSKTPEARRSKTPEARRSKTPEARRFSKTVTVNRQNKPFERRQSSSGSSSEKPKRRFLRKIFGKKKSKSEDDVTTLGSGTTNSRRSPKNALICGTGSGTSGNIYASDSGGDSKAFDVDNDRPEVFFAHDEISTLTAPTVVSNRRDGKDPDERANNSDQASEPVGRYWNHFSGFGEEEKKEEQEATAAIDPFNAPFFQFHEPSGVSLTTKTASPRKEVLHISVPSAHDPTGESPLNSRKAMEQPQVETGRSMKDPSPRGFQSPTFAEHSHDPVGESPLHKHERGPSALRDGSPYAADPPLFLEGGFIDDSSEETSKKGRLPGAIVPPPPPPPPPPPSTPSPRSRSRIPISPRNPSPPVSSPSPTSDSVSTAKETIQMVARSPRVPVYPKAQGSPASTASTSSKNSTHVSTRSKKESSPTAFLVNEDGTEGPPEKCEHTIKDGAQPVEEDSVKKAKSLTVDEDSAKKAKSLNMSSVARMNAKAVAYIHTMNGDPSPRNAWHRPEFSDDEASPAHATHAAVASLETTNVVLEATNDESTIKEAVPEDASNKLFSAYSGKFRGRRPLKAGSRELISSEEVSADTLALRQNEGQLHGRNAVGFGVALLRKKREQDIASGRATRVVLVKKVEVPVVQSYFGPREDPEPKDPIQRAGRRLLAKAAIPIQAASRRYLAQREAVDRMWALIELQSYFRRFRAEAFLFAHRQSAMKIQAAFHGSKCRAVLRQEHLAAIHIQKIVRGYLTAVNTYDAVFRIILCQARARGNIVRLDIAEQASRATSIQSIYRGFRIRKAAEERENAACRLQTMFRSFSARMRFQFDMVDIIIAQNIARRWLARRVRDELYEAKKLRSVIKIQSIWRGFQGYTDYIFVLVDVLFVQRTARRWLATRRTKALRREVSATKIQTEWRRYCAQVQLLFDLVHIIMVQSVARRYLARSTIRDRQVELDVQTKAAIKIQTAWRCFWGFSHFVILQFEASRVQAIIRGYLVRKQYSLRLGCAIMIQSVARRYLAIKDAKTVREQIILLDSVITIQCIARRFLAVQNVRILRNASVVVNATVLSMRETIASRNIQFWWRVVLDCRKEKEAALVIERFFIMVKIEVDREIRRVAKKKKSKSSERRRKKKESDEQLLERVWLNTVDEDHVDVFAYSPSLSASGSRLEATSSNISVASSKSGASASGKNNVRHRASSPPMNLVMRHEYDVRPSDSLQYSPSAASSQVSGVTAESSKVRKSKLSGSELSDNLLLEESFVDTEIRHKKEKKSSSEKYLKIYGIKTAPSRSSDVSHFFDDTTETPTASQDKRKSLSSLPTSHSTSGSGKNSRKSKKAESPRHGNSSPRHGKILVVNPYPDTPSPRKHSRGEVDVEYVGEEFGMI